MIPVTILVPFLYQDVEDEDKHFSMQRHIADLFGGVSIDTNGGFGHRGLWIDRETKRVVQDENVKYTIACNPIQDGPKLQEIISLIKDKFNQQAVYLEYLGHAEIL